MRDSLSVLDQLIGGAEGQQLSYERTIAAARLHACRAAGRRSSTPSPTADGAALFGVVDSVIDAGLDPERFMKDLLERFRDLVIVAAVEDAFERRLVGGSDDQRSRLQSQADRIGLAALTRCTELVATGIADMKGPTPPRLHLELVSAKLLLPGAHDDELSLAARLDRIERRMSIAGAAEATETPAAPSGTTPSSPATQRVQACTTCGDSTGAGAASAASRTRRSRSPSGPSPPPSRDGSRRGSLGAAA